MYNQLKKALNTKQTMMMFYQDKQGKVTQRFIRVLDIKDDYIVAYCFWRKKVRTFSITGILSIGKAGRKAI
ncbi:hypothetical protein P5G51_005695 [Virgibacillus sp. 179-BFC.A HS]|uniref:WYL domain-containing protein n=1 Tax=Tigheibacillus jepli TaxID=3035914 RepID=A0ABU5CFG6_9BACI|nr:hypothetical protein [Virgibacillus sp. 179-BFC.A HS]MDY0404960.1 hypothetical protein [Virgibacillus sp. 179-BFC.A HS]